MYSPQESADIDSIKEMLGEVIGLLKTGHTKKVSGAKGALERIIAEEKVVPRKALKARTGVSDAELSRCLGALEKEGKLIRRVDTKDGRKTVCVHVEAVSTLSYDEQQLLAVIHGNPDLAYRELEAGSGFATPKAFQAAFYKLLAMGLVGQADADGRMYAVVTTAGMETLKGASS